MIKKNNFKKIIVVIVAIVVVLLFFSAGTLFFIKNNNTLKLSDNQQIEKPDKKRELTEEEKARMTAENFVVTYYSYIWGNFSNVESQYYYMTEEMKNREKVKVEKMKREIEGQPQRYFTVQAKITSSNFVEYQEGKASLDIEIEIEEFNGAVIAPEGMEILVDINGNVYEGNPEDLVERVFNKKVKVNLIKTEKEWKVERIKDIE